MLRVLRASGFGIAWLCVFIETLHAEPFPLTPARLVQESELVLVGKILNLRVGTEQSHIERGFGNYDWAIDLTLKIQSIEKGQLDQSDTIVARCFRIKSRNSQIGYVSVSGNHPIPEVGAEVRAHLYRDGQIWRVVFPNGFTPASEGVSFSDSAAVRSLSSRRYTFGLPLEMWFCLVVIYMVFQGIATFVKRRRRLHASEQVNATRCGDAP